MSNSPFDAAIPSHWQLSTLAEILQKPIVKPKWIIEDLLLEQSATLVSGLPHACKSLNWLYAALESVTTRKVWGHFACPGVNKVLYVETEDPQILVESRVQQFAMGLPMLTGSPGSFILASTGPFTLTESEMRLNALIDEIQPDWMVLSTLQGLLGGRDWKEQSEMGPVNAVFVRLSRKCPLVVITHSPWNPENKRAAGSVTQAANFLTLMHFEKNVREHETVIRVQVDSKMGNEAPSFDLVLNTKSGELGSISYTQSSQQDKVKSYLVDNPSATPEEVMQELRVSRSSFFRAKKKGKIQ